MPKMQLQKLYIIAPQFLQFNSYIIYCKSLDIHFFSLPPTAKIENY
jgi:hypothetical protein